MASFPSLPAILQPKEEDIQMMLSAGVHTGTRNSDSSMEGKTQPLLMTMMMMMLLSIACWAVREASWRR